MPCTLPTKVSKKWPAPLKIRFTDRNKPENLTQCECTVSFDGRDFSEGQKLAKCCREQYTEHSLEQNTIFPEHPVAETYSDLVSNWTYHKCKHIHIPIYTYLVSIKRKKTFYETNSFSQHIM